MKPRRVVAAGMCMAVFSAALMQAAPPASAAGKTYTLEVRVFTSGEAARAKGGQGLSQLKAKEREMAGFLGYRDYKLLTSGKKAVKMNGTMSLTFDGGKSVMLCPVKDSGERVTLEVQWDVKDGQRWRKKLFFKPNSRAFLGGPKIEGGGMYVVSVLVK